MDEQYPRLLAKFEESGTKPWEVLHLPPEDIARRVKVSKREIERFRDFYQREGVQPALTDITHETISTQMPELDALLGNGLHYGAITEVCGAAGTGKTCFCCQMALCAASAVYIASEDDTMLAYRRMEQMALRYHGLRHVKFVRVRTLPELRVVLHQIRTFQLPPDLVVLDSIAALVPANTVTDFINTELDDTVGLRRLCAETGCAVIVANQVRDRVGLEDRRPGPVFEFEQQEILQSDAHVRPYLGPEWTARLDSRLLLRRTGRLGRQATLVFSKWAPYGSVPMRMTESGLRVGEPADDQPLSQTPTSQLV